MRSRPEQARRNLLRCRSDTTTPLAHDPTTTSEEFARELAQNAADKQGTEIVILDVSTALAITDFFVIITARNTRHAQALARALDVGMKQKGILRRNVAGMNGDSGWVLLDFETVVVHVFSSEAREYWQLAELRSDVPKLDFTAVETEVVEEEGWFSTPEDLSPDSIDEP